MNNKDLTKTSNAETVTISRTEYENLVSENNWFREQLLHKNRKLYGTSSEKADESLIEQLSLLFNEAEACSDKPEEASVQEASVAGYTRKARKSGSVRDVVPDDVKIEEVPHRLAPEDRICPQCGEIMQEIGKEVVETLVLKPAEAILRRDIYYTYACKQCEQEDTHTPVQKTPHTPAVIPGSYASPEAIAYLMVQKYCMCVPLYRMEQDYKRQNILLSRQTMANWMIRGAADWLQPVYDELHKELVKHDLLHADETTVQVLKEPGKPATSESYMWMYRTSGDAEQPIVLYEYQDNRRKENPKEFLEGFHGYLQTDGYAGYNSVEDVIHVGCWAHARRKFHDAVQALPKGKKGGAALEGEAWCSKLFKIEETLSELTPEERYAKRLELEKPVLDAIFAWANTRNAAPKSKLGIALTYLKNQQVYLSNYLLDGRIELSNNRAERSIKPFVMSRKNFLFSNTPSGARSSAVIFSLIETAKENGLNPYQYLQYVLKTAPGLDQSKADWCKILLPQNAPDECKMNNTK